MCLMWLELLVINVPLCLSVYKYQNVKCSFTSPASMKSLIGSVDFDHL